jgi:hypothetical protein
MSIGHKKVPYCLKLVAYQALPHNAEIGIGDTEASTTPLITHPFCRSLRALVNLMDDRR